MKKLQKYCDKSQLFSNYCTIHDNDIEHRFKILNKPHTSITDALDFIL